MNDPTYAALNPRNNAQQSNPLSQRLRVAREKKGMTQAQAAEKIDVNHNTIYRYESGRSTPSQSMLIALAQTYGTTVAWLLGEEWDETGVNTEDQLITNRVSNYSFSVDGLTEYQKSMAVMAQMVRLFDMQISIDHHYFPIKVESQDDESGEIDVLELLLSERAGTVCILGPSGAGKTTSIRRLIWDSADRGDIVFLVSLRDYPEPPSSGRFSPTRSLKDGIRRYELGDETTNILNQLIEAREGTFIFDGFDELRSNPSWAGRVAASIETFFANKPKCKVIITSRAKEDLQGHFERFSFYQVKPLELREIESFCSMFDPKFSSTGERLREIAERGLFELRPVMILIAMLFARQTSNFARGERLQIGSLFQLLDMVIGEVLLERERIPPPGGQIHMLLPEEVQKIRLDVLTAMVRNWPTSARPCRVPAEDIKMFVSSALSHLNQKFTDLTPEEMKYLIPTGLCLERVEWLGGQEFGFVHASIQDFFYAKVLLDDIGHGQSSLLASDYYSAEILELLSEALSPNHIKTLLRWMVDTNVDLMVRKDSVGILGFLKDRVDLEEKLQQEFLEETDIGVAGRIAEALRRIGIPEVTHEFIRKLDRYPNPRRTLEPPVDEVLRPLTFEIDHILEGFEDERSRLLSLLDHHEAVVRKHALILLMRLEEPLQCHHIVRLCHREVQRINSTLRNQDESPVVPPDSLRSLLYGVEALGRNGSRIEQPFAQWTLDRLREFAVDPVIIDRLKEVVDRLGRNPWLPSAQLRETDYSPIVYLIRHGESDGNAEDRLLGCRSGGMLTGRGMRQAEAAAIAMKERVKNGIIVVSGPLVRAELTASKVADAFSCGLATDSGLTELDFGNWTGMLKKEIAINDKEAFRAWQNDNKSNPPPNGESFFQVQSRSCGAMSLWLQEAASQGKDLVLVTHYFPLAAVYEALTGDEFSHPDNCAITCLQQKSGYWSAVYLNDTQHLDQIGVEPVQWPST